MANEFAEQRVDVSIDNTQVPKNAAKSTAIPFPVIERLGVDLSIPLRRPSKRQPDDRPDSFEAELAAWDAASDEALEHLEEGLDAAE